MKNKILNKKVGLGVSSVFVVASAIALPFTSNLFKTMEVFEVKLNIALLVTFLALTSMFGFFVYKGRNAANKTIIESRTQVEDKAEAEAKAEEEFRTKKSELLVFLKSTDEVPSGDQSTGILDIYKKINNANDINELQEIICKFGVADMFSASMVDVYSLLGTSEEEVKSRIENPERSNVDNEILNASPSN